MLYELSFDYWDENPDNDDTVFIAVYSSMNWQNVAAKSLQNSQDLRKRRSI